MKGSLFHEETQERTKREEEGKREEEKSDQGVKIGRI
jgi:hypothetical protein